MNSMRPWPKAPRCCLLASTLCSEVTCDAKSVMFRCALSMTASRSLSLCRLSTVCWRVVVIDWLRLCVTESSRSFTARWSSAWRPASITRIAPAQRPHCDHDEHGQDRKARKDDCADEREEVIGHSATLHRFGA